MRPLLCLSLVFLCAFTFAAAPPAPMPAAWLKLIDDLGDDDARPAATKKLDALGEDVLPLLRRAEKAHADPDVRLRAAVLGSAIGKRVFGEIRRFVGHSEGVICFALSPDGKRLVSSAGNRGKDHTQRVWDVETGKELFRLGGHVKAVCGVVWSADGTRILTGGQDGRLIFHDAKAGKAMKTIATDKVIGCVALTVDGKCVVSCDETKAVRVWDVQTGKQTALNEDATQGVRSVAMLPDGKHFLSASYDGGVRVIELATGKRVREMAGGHGDRAAWFVTPSRDGKYVASTGSACTALLWDAKSGRRLLAFHGHTENVANASFSHDGSRLITAGYDVPRVWDVKTGKQLQSLEGHEGIVTCVAFLPDGRAITSSSDKTLRLWNVRK